MKNDPQRASRDAAVTAWHNEAVTAGQTERMLVRAINGELVSYLPEESGVARMTHGNTITSVWANWLMAGIMIAIMVVIPWSILVAIGKTNGHPSFWLWLLPLIFVPLALYFAKKARREAKAVKLRYERGLPAPTSQTIDSKWHRTRPDPAK